MKVYQIKIQLIDLKPSVWRRVLIPANFTFKRLHEVIQLSMGWLDQHHYEYVIENENLRITNDEKSYKEYKACIKENKDNKNITQIKKTNTKISNYLEKYTGIDYYYDLTNPWCHKIKLEKTMDDYELEYPQIIEGAGTCPPENVGGIDGYKEFLIVWNDPSHPEYEEIRAWAENLYYNNFDMGERNDLLKAFAYRIY
jgi:hypothetical protein